jgi:hypothetical protein
VQAVDVGHEARRGLRATDGENLVDLEAAERIDRRAGPTRDACASHLAKHAVGDGVVHQVKAGVALGVPRAEALRVCTESVDADPLRADTDVGETLVEDHRGVTRLEDLAPGGHVVPLDDDRAVETRRVDRAANDDARRER